MPISDLRMMLKGYPGDWRPDTDREKGLPEPACTKTLPADAIRIQLPPWDTVSAGTTSLTDALMHRRSHRTFTGDTLSSNELGFLLWSTQGVTQKATEEGEQSRRTAPSAGGRYPLETYVLALRVDGVPRGIHQYRPETHELVTLRTDPDLSDAIIEACYQQSFVAKAAVVVVWSALPERTIWKYGYLFPRMIAMEAGHACQNLYLACETIGAGTCALLSYDQMKLDRLLGVDGTHEFAIYLAPVGKIAK